MAVSSGRSGPECWGSKLPPAEGMAVGAYMPQAGTERGSRAGRYYGTLRMPGRAQGPARTRGQWWSGKGRRDAGQQASCWE